MNPSVKYSWRSLYLGVSFAFATSKLNLATSSSEWPNTFYFFPATIFLVFLLLASRNKVENSVKIGKFFLYALIFTFALVLIPLFSSELPLRTLTSLPILFVAFLIFFIFKEELSFQEAYFSLATAGTVHAIFQLSHTIGLLTFLGPAEVGTFSGLTWYYLQANHFVAISTLMWGGARLMPWSMKPNFFIQFLLITLGLADILISGSRFYTVALIVGLLLIGLVSLASRRNAILAVLTSFLIVGFFQYSSAFYSLNRLTLFAETGTSTYSDYRRLEIQELSWNLVASNPFGIGWGNFVIHTISDIHESIASSHNLYSEIALDFGIVGLLFFLAIVSFLLLRLIRIRDSASFVVSVPLLTILLAGLVDSVYVFPPTIIFHSAIFGMLFMFATGRRDFAQLGTKGE